MIFNDSFSSYTDPSFMQGYQYSIALLCVYSHLLDGMETKSCVWIEVPFAV